MGKIRILIFFVSLVTVSIWAQSHDENTLISLPLDHFRVLQSTMDSLDRLFIRDGKAFVLANQATVEKIRRSGLNHTRLGPVFHQSLRENVYSEGGINGTFHDSLESEMALRELAQNHPFLATFINLGSSVEGRSINALRISAAPDDPSLPRIYIIGCHHAREWISVEVPLDFARYLLEPASSDARVRNCLENSQIYILPVLNPDGLEYSIYRYRYWRKNRRYNGNFHWGVDLNRNYGYSWGIDDTGSSSDPGNDTYRGPGEFSEPETAVLREFMNIFPPSGVVSYHNFSQKILYPWGYTHTPSPDEGEMTLLASRMSEEMRKVNGRKYDIGSGADSLYLTNGGIDDWAYGVYGAFSFTIELPPPSKIGHFFTDEDEIEPICLENRPALLAFISHFIEKRERNPAYRITRGIMGRRSDLR